MNHANNLAEYSRHSRLLVLALREQNFSEYNRILKAYFLLQTEILKHFESKAEEAHKQIESAKEMLKRRESRNCLKLLR